MSELYHRLISVLVQELTVFRDLESLLQLEKDVITKWDAAQLEEIANRKHQLQVRLGEFEKQRKAVITELADVLHLEEKNPPLKALAESAPRESREQINKIRHIFKRLSKEISRQVADNNERLNRSLWVIQNLRNLILKQIEKPVTYDKIGREPLTKNDVRMNRGRRV